jgi:hypothetical protein
MPPAPGRATRRRPHCPDSANGGAAPRPSEEVPGSPCPTPWFRCRLVQHHPDQQRQRVPGQQLVRLVDLTQVQSHGTTVADHDRGRQPLAERPTPSASPAGPGRPSYRRPYGSTSQFRVSPVTINCLI